MKIKSKLFGIFCLILGILSIAVFYAPIPIAISLSIVSIFLFFIEIGIKNKPSVIGIVGVVFGFLGLIVGIVYIYCYYYLFKFVDMWTIIDFLKGLFSNG